MKERNRNMDAWERISAAYQQRRQLSTHVVSLGALVEDELATRLLGDVRDKRALDAGCGGGQNAIALARLGARVLGIDASKAQIDHARALAAQEGVEISFEVGDIEDLGAIAADQCDLMLSIAVLHYLEDPLPALREAARILLPAGKLIVSVDHPFRSIFWETDGGEWSLYPVRDYQTHGGDRSAIWRYPDTDVALTTWHHTIEEWVTMVDEAGLHLTALYEPAAPADLLEELWPEDDALSPLRHIPHTLILVAKKPLQ